MYTQPVIQPPPMEKGHLDIQPSNTMGLPSLYHSVQVQHSHSCTTTEYHTMGAMMDFYLIVKVQEVLPEQFDTCQLEGFTLPHKSMWTIHRLQGVHWESTGSEVGVHIRIM